MNANPWFRCMKPVPAARSRLYCIPFAGGGPAAFRNWPALLPGVEVWAVHLPGREARMREPAFANMNALINALLPEFTAHATGDVSVFGHSMGAMVAFELARRLDASNTPAINHLFVSGHGAPSAPAKREMSHQLPHDAFLERIRAFDGTPEAVLQHPELLEIFVPLLRADITVLETHPRAPDATIAAPLTALASDADPEVPVDAMHAWRTHTQGAFDCRVFHGGHFYWQTDPEPMLAVIRETLSNTSGAASP